MSLPLAIILSVSGVIILVFWLSCFGIQMKKIKRIILCSVSFLLFVQIARKKIEFHEMRKDTLIKLFLSIIPSIIYLGPIVITRRLYFYSDLQTYCSMADWYRDSTYFTPVALGDYNGWLNLVEKYYTEGLRCGSQFLLSFFTDIFSVEFSIELFAPVMAFGIFLYTLAIWHCAENFIGTPDRKTINVMILFCGLNSTVLLWTATTGLMPQMYGFSLALTVVSLFINKCSFNKKGRMHIAFGIIGAALVLVYGEIVPFIVLGLLIYFGICYLENKSDGKIMLRYLMLELLAVVIFSAIYIPNFVKSIFFQMSDLVGYEIPFGILEYLGYFFSTIYVNTIYSFDTIDFFQIISLFMTISLLILFVKSFFSGNYGRDIKKEFLCLSIPFIVMGIYYLFLAENPYREGETGNSWNIYKIIQYYTALMLPYVVYLILRLIYQIKYKKIMVFLFWGWCVFNIVSAISYSNYITVYATTLTGNKENPTLEYYKLSEKYRNYEGKIYLCNISSSHQLAISYFLQNNQLNSCWSKNVINYKDDGIILTYAPLQEGEIANLAETDVWFEILGAIHEPEYSTQEMWQWAFGDSEIVAYPGDGLYMVEFGIKTLDNEERIIVYLDDEVIFDGIVDSLQGEKIKFYMSGSGHEERKIRIEYDGNVYTGYNGDTRSLAYRIIDFSIHKENAEVIMESTLYDEEHSGETSWRWASDDTTIEVMGYDSDKTYQVSFGLSALRGEENVIIYLDKEIIFEGNIDDVTIERIEFIVKGDQKHTIEIVYNGKSYTGINGDPRTLAYRIIDFEVYEY